MSDPVIPTIKELSAWMTGGNNSALGMQWTTVEKTKNEDVDPNKIVDGFQNKPYVTVGIHESAGMHIPDVDPDNEIPPPVTIAQVGFWNEFGTKRIPRASFMRSTMDNNKEKHLKFFNDIVQAIMTGKMGVDRGLAVFGERLQADVQNTIRAISKPENAPSTKAGKYPKTHPLIDSGQMLGSIRYVVGGDKSGK